ncbi:MAG: hypothetical protein QW365_01300 [Candidatus Nezhaarchaeales archaeon]
MPTSPKGSRRLVMVAVKVSNLVKRFGRTVVLKGLSFDVKEGEIFGLVGPNGLGKLLRSEF